MKSKRTVAKDIADRLDSAASKKSAVGQLCREGAQEIRRLRSCIEHFPVALRATGEAERAAVMAGLAAELALARAKRKPVLALLLKLVMERVSKRG